jgi:serine-type D-Ala-D-Ala carboxypeptidase/endopeptidase (penicillin-binding protein 4)
MSASDIPEASLGGVVLRLRDGKTLWSYQSTRPMQPASTIKTLTSIVALDTLKPSHQATTQLVTRATQVGDVLKGELALVGRGADEFSVTQLQAALRALRTQGVRVIEGDLLLDREYFQPPRPYENVPPFDEAPEFRYNIIPDALMLASNLNQLSLASDESTIRVAFAPKMEAVEFVSALSLVEKPCSEWENLWKIPRVETLASGTIRVTLLGEFPKLCVASTEINVLNRTDFADRLVRSAWKDLGGEWRGVAREGAAPVGSNVRVISTQESRTLAEFNRDINKRSDNAMTRTAFLTLGARASVGSTRGDGSAPTAERADAVVRSWLRERGIDDTGLVLENGSGLSRIEMISPMMLAHTLRAAQASKWSSEFMMSLPIVGVDGAMRNRLKDSPANEIGRMKTGGLRNVVSVAGYLRDARGEPLIVVLFLNHDNVGGGKGRAVLDALMTGFMQ